MAKRNYDAYPQINLAGTGKRLRRLCKEKEISVKDIQAALGLGSNQAVYDWFNGKTLPTLNNFWALGRLLGIPMEYMLVSDVVGNNEVRVVDLRTGQSRILKRLTGYRDRLAECA